LTGYHTLLMVDGIRVNDSVLRAGPNDLWGTVDPRSIGRLEVVYGSSSVLYGSDSMGGTVNILPKSRLERGETSDWDRRVAVTYQSATNSFENRAELEGNIGKDFGWFVGGTIANYGNVRARAGR
jgi:hemoglobin/transferrin/lactoferrin receptor protein